VLAHLNDTPTSMSQLHKPFQTRTSNDGPLASEGVARLIRVTVLEDSREGR
jgi:hypothetical protein